MLGKASVIIINWNGEQFLERCLAQLTAQTVQPHEIIVLDNASTDGSVELARQFSDVKVIALDKNTGFAQGNNLAIEAASPESDLIALLNPDAFAKPRWLEALLSAAAEKPEFDVFGSKLVNANDQSIVDGAGDVYHISGLVWRLAHGAPLASIEDRQREIFSPCAAAALYRRSALSAVHGFDEDYFCYVEDVDLGFRLRLMGYRCLYVPGSIALHVGSGTTGGQHSDFAIYQGHRNLVWTFFKNMPGVLLWLLLPLHLLMNAAALILFSIRGKGRVIWRAKRDALFGLPEIIRKRRKVQRNRTVDTGQIWRQLDKRVIPTRREK